MKRVITRIYLIFGFALLVSWSAVGQILHPASWEYGFSKDEVSVGDEVDLVFRITIDPKWYLYSSDFDPDLGPKVTEFTFTSDNSYELVDGIRPIGAKEGYDEIFEGNYTYFKGTGEFRQTVRILEVNPVISGSYDYQVCSDIDGKCIPFDESFSFSGLKVIAAAEEQPQKKPSPTTPPEGKSAELQETEDEPGKDSRPLKPLESFELAQQSDTSEMVDEANSGASNEIKQGNIWSQKSPNTPYTLLTFMIGAFFAGFLALLTPCVYPMIPMTVTFFTNNRSNRKKGVFHALFYGICIMLIFTLLGTLVSVLGGPEFANWIATHWLPNMIFFVMFVFFALWFLGLFELNLPNSIVNSVDRKSEAGGLVGVFFMALTLVLVSFSCTGPFVGSILIASSSGHVLMPVLGMLGFSAAFALTFSAFAIFPEWLKTLPRSGSWLNTVKVFLGFIELALSLKFLSMVDQVYHWGILDRDVFIAIWVSIMLALSAYLLGIIRLPSDGESNSIGIPRLLTAIAVLGFTVYIIPGMWGAPLKPLAGYLPPITTQDFRAQGFAVPVSAGDPLCDEPKYAELLKLPHGLNGYFDLDQALECAIEQDKPVFIDFTGHGCVNCREMEAVVWSDPEVLSRLRDDYMVVALYVDEKTELPESQWYTSDYDNKIKKTMGKQNADLQIRWYGNNAQPFYVLLDPKYPQHPLVEPVAYDKSIPNFIEFLDQGLEAHKSRRNLGAIK